MPNSTFNAFSGLAQRSVPQIRNCANEPELRGWLEAVFLEKFDIKDDRAEKAWAWCASVGRKHMLREGAHRPHLVRPGTLDAGPQWVREAVAAGKPLTALSLEASERELFLAILDWMRSPSGPALGSDWSKISVPQAKAAELAWIDAMAKAAAKRNLEAADAAGTELFEALGPQGSDHEAGRASGSGWSGWRWVEVKSEAALEREGSLMRHCVGSYAKAVSSGRLRIYSLRDPSNAPRLTVEAKGAKLVQIQAFANTPCPAELRPAVASFAKAFEADAASRGLGVASASEELATAGVASLPVLGLVVGELSATQADELRGMANDALGGLPEAKRNLGKLAPGLAGLGLAGDLATAISFSTKRCREQAFDVAASAGSIECLRVLIEALGASEQCSAASLSRAANGGHAECVGLLIPLCDAQSAGPALGNAARKGRLECLRLLLEVSGIQAEYPEALHWAANEGHAECVKLLMPLCSAKNVGSALCAAADNNKPECVKLLLTAPSSRAEKAAALHFAAENGHAECVKLLAVQFVDAKVGSPEALCGAAMNGHAECVKLLIPVSNPKAQGSRALSAAAMGGHAECVKLLIPVSDPQAKGSRALSGAAMGGHAECVKLLIPFSGPQRAVSKASQPKMAR